MINRRSGGLRLSYFAGRSLGTGDCTAVSGGAKGDVKLTGKGTCTLP